MKSDKYYRLTSPAKHSRA